MGGALKINNLIKNLVTLKFLLLFAIIHIAFGHSYANTYVVKKKGKFKSIQQAVDFCVTGDSIIVYPGVYYENNLKVDKPLTLIGVKFPVLDGKNQCQIITVTSSYVSIKGFKIQHSSIATLEDPAGVKILDSRNVNISGNIFDDTFFAIYLSNCVNCTVKNNKLNAYGTLETEIGNGIHCWKSDSLKIIGNIIIGHRDGIYFEFVKNSIIWRNISKNNKRYGLHFMFSHGDTYISNVFKNNGAGVAVMFTKDVKMYNNYFLENWGDAAYGLLLKEISDSFLEGNVFERNTMGVFMEGAARMSMKKNVFKNNGWAIRIQASCADVNMNRNNFLANTFDISTNGTLVLNNFDGNYWDKYEGYDLHRDGIGDVPFHPINLYSMIIETNPPAMILFRSIIVNLLDKSEKMIPSLTPDNLADKAPLMKALPL